jgi:hypothetical protein
MRLKFSLPFLMVFFLFNVFEGVATGLFAATPVAPSGLTTSSTGFNTVTLNWTDNTTDETGFKIERKTGTSGTWGQIATVGVNVVTYSNAGLANLTYYYRVRAYNGEGDSAYSNEVMGKPLPYTPTNLVAMVVSSSQIDLTWTDNSGNEDGVSIDYRPSSSTTWTPVDVNIPNTISYSKTGLAESVTYYFRLRAYHEISGTRNYSGYSNTLSATTFPQAPSNLTAAAASATSVNLNWADNSSGETGFKIERKTGSGGTWAQITSVGANVTTYQDTGLTTQTTYYYRVRATNAGGDSAYSNQVSATPPSIPVPPNNLTAASISVSQINISWADNSGNEYGFKIERKTGSGGNWGQIATVGPNITTYQDTGLSVSTTYYYRVRSYTVAGTSNPTNEASATTFPQAPSNLTATPVSATAVNLDWTDNSPDEISFKIEHKAGAGGTWAQVATVGTNVTTYQDTGLTTQTTYYYRVRATNAGGDSAYSNQVSATPPSIPVPPNNLTATSISVSQINISWADNSGNEYGFKIERKTGSGGNWGQNATVGPNITTYQDTGLSASTTYYYRVRSYTVAGTSNPTNEASATTFPQAPSNLTAAPVSATAVNLGWTDNSPDEISFRIERKAGSGGSWAQVATVGTNVTTYQDTGLTTQTTYYYRVRATNAGGDSAYSNQVSATPPSIPVPPNNLTATSISVSQINISWADNSGNEEGFKIERKTGSGGTWAQIATVTSNITTYPNTGLLDSTVYYYRVRSYNVAGNSNYTNEAYATTYLQAPSNLTASAISSTEINLEWTDNSAGETSFKIERKAGSGGTWGEIGVVGSNAIQFTSDNLSEVVEYYYRVRASNAGGNSTYSNEASATTLPSAPTNLTATVISDTSIQLTWEDNSIHETSSRIERKLASEVNWTEIAVVNANVTLYDDTTALLQNGDYQYRVRTYMNSVSSDYSNTYSIRVTTFLPLELDINSGPVLMGPGKGWVAYVDMVDTHQGYNDIINFDGTRLANQLDTLLSKSCDIIYIRITWNDFEMHNTELNRFLHAIHDYNNPVPPNSPKTFEEKFKVILRLMFVNTCYVSASPEDFPCTPEFGWDYITRSFNLASDCNPNVLEIKEFDYMGKNAGYPVNYANIPAVTVFNCWNGRIRGFVDQYPQTVISVEPGFMGNWGENHLLAFYSNNPLHSGYYFDFTVNPWDAFYNIIKLWFNSFADIMYANSNLKVFMCSNLNWIQTKYLNINDYPNLPPVATDKIPIDMFQIAQNNRFQLRVDNSPTHRLAYLNSIPELERTDDDKRQIQQIKELNYHYHDFLFKNESPGPGIMEFSQSNLATITRDLKGFYFNYSQLRMPSTEWTLQDTIDYASTSEFNKFKNLLGYRFQVNSIKYVNLVQDNKGCFYIKISNIGYGYCDSKIRLVIKPNGKDKYYSDEVDGKLLRRESAVEPTSFSNYDPLTHSHDIVHYVPIGVPVIIPPDFTKWTLIIEVQDQFEHWVPVKWSNHTEESDDPIMEMEIPFDESGIPN